MLALIPIVLLAGAPTSAAKASAAAEAMCQEDAQCEGPFCHQNPHCSSVQNAPFQAPKGAPTFFLRATRSDVGEGDIVEDRYFSWNGKELVALFKITSDTGGDGPHASTSSVLVVCKAQTNGVPELDERVEKVETESPTSAEGEWKSTVSHEIAHYTWTGKSFERAPADKPCAPRPFPPAWLQSAAASSALVEKGLPAAYYAPANAADGLAETAWAEGARGPGAGEWLELQFALPMTITRFTLMGGCGTTEKLWLANQRLKSVTLLFSDGQTQKVSLKDVKFRERELIILARTTPTSSLRIVVDEVYPAKFEDACISEVELVGK